MVWPVSSDKWKALFACVADDVSLQTKRTLGGRGERGKCDEERSEKKGKNKRISFLSIRRVLLKQATKKKNEDPKRRVINLPFFFLVASFLSLSFSLYPPSAHVSRFTFRSLA